MADIKDYLFKDYDIIRSEEYLKTSGCIERYFRGCDHLFECGQGYYQETATSMVLTADGKFYEVTTTADIQSSKQDRGDRLYWVENIESVAFKEAEIPPPREKVTLSVEIQVYVDRRDSVIGAIEAMSCSSRVLP